MIPAKNCRIEFGIRIVSLSYDIFCDLAMGGGEEKVGWPKRRRWEVTEVMGGPHVRDTTRCGKQF